MKHRGWLVAGMCVFAFAVLAITSYMWAFMNENEERNTAAIASGDRVLTVSVPNDSPFARDGSKVISAFEQVYPEVHIVINVLSDGTTDYRYQRYRAAFAAGQNDADVMLVDLIWIPEFAKNGWIAPLDECFTETWLERFLPTALKSCRYAGRLYAVPCMIDVPVLFYRKDLIESPPTTYEELIEVGGRLAEEHGMKYNMVLPLQPGESSTCAVLDVIFGCGGMLMNEENVPSVDSDSTQKAFLLLQELVDSSPGGTDLYSFTEKDCTIAFLRGDGVFMRNWQGNSSYLQEIRDSLVTGKIASAPMPAGGENGVFGTGTMGGWHYVVNAQCENITDAQDFLEFISTEEIQRENMLLADYPPTLSACYVNENFWEEVSEVQNIPALYENMQFRPSIPNYMEFSQSLSAIFFDGVRNVLSPRQAAAQLEKVTLQYLSDF